MDRGGSIILGTIGDLKNTKQVVPSLLENVLLPLDLVPARHTVLLRHVNEEIVPDWVMGFGESLRVIKFPELIHRDGFTTCVAH